MESLQNAKNNVQCMIVKQMAEPVSKTARAAACTAVCRAAASRYQRTEEARAISGNGGVRHRLAPPGAGFIERRNKRCRKEEAE